MCRCTCIYICVILPSQPFSHKHTCTHTPIYAHILSPSPQNPQTAIPKGTFVAIAITTVVYVVMAVMVGSIFLRDAPGEYFFSGLETNATNCSNDTLITLNVFQPVNSCSSVYDFAANFPECNCTLQQCSEDLPFCVDGSGALPTRECILGDQSPSVLEEICGSGFLGLVNRSSCDFGLLNHLQVMNSSTYRKSGNFRV